ncbi:MAG TPA: hypothetical protein P5287_05955, partial [bacterium]|nr:hypothetical protein [bacterium]
MACKPVLWSMSVVFAAYLFVSCAVCAETDPKQAAREDRPATLVAEPAAAGEAAGAQPALDIEK